MERAGVVIVLHEFPGLGRRAGRRRGDHRLDAPGREQLRHVRNLHHRRTGAEKLRQAGGEGAVSAELGALEIGDALQRLLGVDALAGPGDRVEQLQAAALEFSLQQRLLRLVELPGVIVAGGHERDVVGFEHRVLVAELREQELGDVHLAGRNRPQDVRMLDQRAVRMHGDVERAVSGFLHILDERAHVAGMELAVGIRRRHVPLGLRLGAADQRRGGQREKDPLLHRISSCQFNVSSTASARASDAVSPGDSMPNRCTSPRTPCSRGPWMRKSAAGSRGPAVFGRMPE